MQFSIQTKGPRPSAGPPLAARRGWPWLGAAAAEGDICTGQRGQIRAFLASASQGTRLVPESVSHKQSTPSLARAGGAPSGDLPQRGASPGILWPGDLSSHLCLDPSSL